MFADTQTHTDTCVAILRSRSTIPHIHYTGGGVEIKLESKASKQARRMLETWQRRVKVSRPAQAVSTPASSTLPAMISVDKWTRDDIE